MATQRETLLIGNPFNITLEHHGWHVKNTHGNQYQHGFPDKYIFHSKYSPRWIEYKVFNEYGHITLTTSQKTLFPIMHSCNVPIFIIAGTDLRGKENYREREKLYQKLFKEPNVIFAFNKSSHHLLK